MKDKILNLIPLVSIFLLLSLGLVFIQKYSWWNDEANTVLFAESILKYGDTYAKKGENWIAYRNATELDLSLRNRYVSPLQYYFLAAWKNLNFQILHSDWANDRFPFLLAGIVGLLFLWLTIKPHLASVSAKIIFALMILNSIALLLFIGQSRYFSLLFLFSSSALWVTTWKVSVSKILTLAILSGLLFCTNYVSGVGFLFLLICMEPSLQKLKNLIQFGTVFSVISIPVVAIWNPIGRGVVSINNDWLDKSVLMLWNFRDFSAGYLGAWLPLILYPLLSNELQKWRRVLAGIILFQMVVAIFSPQPVRATHQSDIRYLIPLLPLTMLWFFNFLLELKLKVRSVWIWPLLLFITSSNVLFIFPLGSTFDKIRFPLAEFIREIRIKSPDVYLEIASLIQRNSNAGSVIQTSWDFAAYPLMLHLPKWKFQHKLYTDESEPDFIVSICDPNLENNFNSLYVEVDHIQTTCEEAYRPEIFWRDFGIPKNIDKIRILKRLDK